jgi:streptogramin lyase
MSQRHLVRPMMLAAAAALVVLPACASAPVVNSPTMAPTNTLANPFQRIENWARMPQGRTWGSTSAVAIDRDGVSVWVGERCGANTCRDSNLDPILLFDQNGNLVRSFGAGMIVWPHGIHVDYEGNVWITDGQSSLPPGAPAGTQPDPTGMSYGHQVHKFSPTGEHLMTLGVRGGAREPQHFWQPNDVLVAPNGDIFVAEGHSNNPEVASARIIKFDRNGNFITQWGRIGNGPTDLMQPHALAMDSRGRLFVGDRSNNRIQIYDQQGNLLDTWYQFSRPSGLFIDSNDNLYVADSESGSLQNTLERPWTRGIRIGDARTGQIRYLIPDPNPDCRGTCTAEGVAVDRNGVIYGAEVGPRGELMRYVR